MTNQNLPNVTIYTDGACKGNPGKGGWGAVLISGIKEKHIYGYQQLATNNQMEILASIKSLEALKKKCNVDLYTDSVYVKNGIQSWMHNWKKNNWKTANKKSVKNKELWQELDVLNLKHNVSWHWVKGHSGDKYNEIADDLANKGAQGFSQK